MTDACCDTTKKYSYTPFIIAIMLVTIYTVGHQLVVGHRVGMTAMNDFMGMRFLLFGLVKLLDLPGFVHNFSKYDLIAHRAKGYAYAFPFLELILGLAYLLDSHMQYRIAINTLTALLVGITALGVFFALKHKKDALCVCMGIHFPLPMSKVALIENISMGIMAVGMLFRMTAVTGQSHAQNMNYQMPASATAVSCH